MNRCGIIRNDGIVRISILCDKCAARALELLLEEKRKFWAKTYQGPRHCEACLEPKKAIRANEAN